ncbi:hypothetical protein [Methanobacterium sp. SMA-27]|nr:hypothetical protein [Methanobacterium sp. SMA-27]
MIWTSYWYDMAILTVFPIIAFVLTMLIKEKMDKGAQIIETRLKKSGLF